MPPTHRFMDGLVVDKWFNLINEKREYAGEIHLVIQMRMCAEYRQRVEQEKQKVLQQQA